MPRIIHERPLGDAAWDDASKQWVRLKSGRETRDLTHDRSR